METKCPICPNESQCGLKTSLKSQAGHGGFKDPSLDRTKGTAGPYWPEGTWNAFAERSKKAAVSQGCLHPDDVAKLADEITQKKKDAGELVLHNSH